MDESSQAQFMSITGASTTTAAQYLQLAEGDVEGAIEIFFANDGATLETATETQTADPSPSRSRRRAAGYEDSAGVVHIDSDDESSNLQSSFRASRANVSPPPESALQTPPDAEDLPMAGTTTDEDEIMARRLQEEFYGSGPSVSAGLRNEALDENGYRAPIGRTTETLVGADSGVLDFDPSNNEEMRAAVMEQMMARRQRHTARERPGIFNQQAGSIWTGTEGESGSHQDRLARATGGASTTSAKASTLAEMYRPPFELMSRLPWDEARSQGKDDQKWILVNIQDPSIFDCQVLNRDIWKNASIMETVKENFIFMQYAKDDQRGSQYMQYYLPDKDLDSAYPHIAIVDPRTGEQVKAWSGHPVPKAPEFLMQLHEFLDRYSLNPTAKNPVAKRKPEARKSSQMERMTEEQQLEMAMRASLAGSTPKSAEDPDELTRSVGNVQPVADTGTQSHNSKYDSRATIDRANANGSQNAPSSSRPFAAIDSFKPHTEPSPTDSASTRIQFRHPNGRVVHRFSLHDSVRRIFEWLKAAPLEGTNGQEFELIFMQKKLIDHLDETIEAAGLRNGTVMVELLDSET